MMRPPKPDFIIEEDTNVGRMSVIVWTMVLATVFAVFCIAFSVWGF